MKWSASIGRKSLNLMSIDFVYDKGMQESVLHQGDLHTIEAELHLQNRSSRRQRGNLLPLSAFR